MNKSSQQPKPTKWSKTMAALALIQLAINVFVLLRLHHQEQMNREQVKFDTTIAQKVFGYDARYSTNVIVWPTK